MATTPAQHDSKTRFLEAALYIIRAKGYTATTLDDICQRAGLTKGSFFHHFSSKEELAIAAADHFGAMATGLFASAPYHSPADPVDRLLGYLDFRIAILQGDLPYYTCLLGTMVQETFETHPAIRDACHTHITMHADELARDIALARAQYAPAAEWTAQSLGLHFQAVIQGSFILAKACNGPQVAADSIRHLRRYVELLFPRPLPTPNP